MLSVLKLSVTKPFTLSVVMLSSVMLNVTYKPFMLSVIMLNAIVLNAIMLGVMVPYSQPFIFFIAHECMQQARVFVPGKPPQPSIM
jgi:hypothetical protein